MRLGGSAPGPKSEPSAITARLKVTVTASRFERATGVGGASGETTAALSVDGSLYLWGTPDSDHDHRFATARRPTRLKAPPDAPPFTAVAVGGRGLVAASGGHKQGAWEWCEGEAAPVPIPSLAGYTVTSVSCGEEHVALIADGAVWTGGSNAEGQLCRGGYKKGGVGIERLPDVKQAVAFVAVSCAPFATTILNADGFATAGGSNEHNALGVMSDSEVTRIAAPRTLDLPSGVRGLVAVACAEHHSVGLTDDGRVLTWGCADDGRLGRKPKSGRDHALPAVVAFPVAEVVPVAVAAGAARSVVVASDGALWIWGRLGAGEGGEVQRAPARAAGDVLGGARFVTAAASEWYTLAVAAER